MGILDFLFGRGDEGEDDLIDDLIEEQFESDGASTEENEFVPFICRKCGQLVAELFATCEAETI